MASENPTPSTPAPAPHVSSWQSKVAVILWLLAALLIVTFFVVSSFDILEPGHKNLASFSAFGGATILLWCWFVFVSKFALQTRRAVAIVSLLLVGSALVLLRFEEVTGDMRPRIVFRWTPKADALLTVPVADAPSVNASAPILSETTEHDYPQFLGPNRRATLTGVNLATDWEQRPPQPLWRQPIGAGWSAFAVVGEHAVTQEQRGDQALVVCYELRTGKVVWSHADPGRFTSVVGGDGPRATPTIVDGKVYAAGADGLLNCLEGATGKLIWSRNVIEETGAKQINWGRAASPLVVDQLVIMPAGGKGQSVIAYDKDSGEIIWAAGDDQVSYASPVLATLHGVPQVLLIMQDWLVSHRLSDGKILFRHPWPGNSDSNASTSQAVVLAGNRVLLSKGYGGGTLLLQVTVDAQGDFSTKELWANHSLLRTKFTNVVLRDGYIYGLSEGVLECVELESGKRQWKRGRYGHGQLLLVDDLLLITSEAGEVALVAANPEKYEELTKFAAIEGKTWNNPALSGNLLLVRNHEEAACYELPTRD